MYINYYQNVYIIFVMFQKPFVTNYLRALLNTLFTLRKHDIEMYVVCIQYLCNKVHDISLAKKYLIKGFEYYKNDKILLMQYIYIELINIESDTSMKVTFKNCKMIIRQFKNDLDFYVKLYDTMEIIMNKNIVARRLLLIMKRYVFNIYFINK